MLSVGVDIPRLGLMVVNGQPKSMAEYIQATSRVGRSKKGPGLIITIYNNTKVRDRAHYETFITWHSALYRSVEATSVTPFAARARDKALHAPLIALARHLLSSGSRPGLTRSKRAEIERDILPFIFERIERIDPRELEESKAQLLDFLDWWEDRSDLKYYWNDRSLKDSLLMSAEVAAARRASGKHKAQPWPTPNSVRNVEPGVQFQLWESASLERGKGNG